MPNCMGAGPPAGDRTGPARRRSSAGGGFEEIALPRHQSAGHRVDDHVRLLEHEVAEERLVAVWSRLHLDEDHLAVDSPEPVDLDPDRPPDVGLDQALIGGLEVDRGHGFQLPQLVLPGEREDEPVRSCVDERLEALRARRVAAVRHRYLHHNLAHPWLPPRQEWADTVHTGTSVAIPGTIIIPFRPRRLDASSEVVAPRDGRHARAADLRS